MNVKEYAHKLSGPTHPMRILLIHSLIKPVPPNCNNKISVAGDVEFLPSLADVVGVEQPSFPFMLKVY